MSPRAAPAAEPVAPFEEVYERYAPDVYRFCLVQLRNPDAAEDATADVFTAALAAYWRVRPKKDGVKFWLLRIARNTVVSHWRSDARRGRLGRVLGARSSPALDVHEAVAIRADLRTVVLALSHLRPRDRTLIGLRAAQLTTAEVADFLNISENAAKVATHRALKALRAQLEECNAG